MLLAPCAKRSTTARAVSGPKPTCARQANERASHSCRALNGSHRPTLMRRVIVNLTPAPSSASSRMAWLRYRRTGSSSPVSKEAVNLVDSDAASGPPRWSVTDDVALSRGDDGEPDADGGASHLLGIQRRAAAFGRLRLTLPARRSRRSAVSALEVRSQEGDDPAPRVLGRLFVMAGCCGLGEPRDPERQLRGIVVIEEAMAGIGLHLDVVVDASRL